MDYYFSEKGYEVCRIDGHVKLDDRRRQVSNWFEFRFLNLSLDSFLVQILVILMNLATLKLRLSCIENKSSDGTYPFFSFAMILSGF